MIQHIVKKNVGQYMEPKVETILLLVAIFKLVTLVD